MSIVTSDFPFELTPSADPDPFRLGWRFVQVRNKHGEETEIKVPLTQEDVLHPQEGDFIVNTPLHDLVRSYLRDASQGFYAGRKGIVITSDCRVNWGSRQGWIHGPDWALFSGCKKPWGLWQATFNVREYGGRPESVLEITSQSTRGNDYGPKKREYFLAGVPNYIIVDIPEEGEEGAIQVFGFKAGRDRYVGKEEDAKGRLALGPGLWIGVSGLNVYLEDEEGQRLPDFNTWKARAEYAEKQARLAEDQARKAEEQARKAEEQTRRAKKHARQAADRARQAEEKAAAELAARQEMEARLRALETELASKKPRS